MIMDNLLLFDGAVAATGAITPTAVNSGTTFTVGATDSANVLDMGQIASSALGLGRDVGIGDDPALEIFVGINTTFTGSSSTMAISVQTAPDNGSGSPGSYTNLVTTPALALSALTAGTEVLRIKMPIGVQKFVKLVYTVAVANMTAGKIVAGIVFDRSALGPLLGYQSGFTTTYM